MGPETRTTIINKILRRIKVAKIAFIIIGIIVSLVGAVLMFPAIGQDSDTSSIFLVSGGSVLASGLFFLLLWGLIILLARKNEKLINDTLGNPNNVVTEWIYSPNQEFQSWKKVEMGWKGPGFRAMWISAIIFAVCGLLITRKLRT
jgi:hypothetical protein